MISYYIIDLHKSKYGIGKCIKRTPKFLQKLWGTCSSILLVIILSYLHQGEYNLLYECRAQGRQY